MFYHINCLCFYKRTSRFITRTIWFQWRFVECCASFESICCISKIYWPINRISHTWNFVWILIRPFNIIGPTIITHSILFKGSFHSIYCLSFSFSIFFFFIGWAGWFISIYKTSSEFWRAPICWNWNSLKAIFKFSHKCIFTFILKYRWWSLAG